MKAFRTKRIAALTLAATLVLSSLVVMHPIPALANGSTAVCSYTAHVTATPGWTILPSKGAGSTNFPAPLSCTGSVEGSPISTEPGTIAYQFTYGTTITAALGGDTCAAGGGTVQFQISLRTVSGTQLHLAGSSQWLFVGGVPSVSHGNLGAVAYTLVIASIPELAHLDQNCVTVPFRYFTDTGEMLLQS